MAYALEFLLLDQSGPSPANGLSLQHLEIGNFVSTDHQESVLRQPLGLGVAPQHHLGALLELRVEQGRFPIAGAMGMQVDWFEDGSYVPGVMVRTMPSKTACRASSKLDPCVRCTPLALGSRHVFPT